MIETIDIQQWLEKPVAILGAGISGKAAADLITLRGGFSVVYDEMNSDFPQEFTREIGQTHSLVIASPGFSTSHPWMLAASEAGCEVIGELDLAYLLWEGGVVAVTGTNGKTTLVEFIRHALEFAGLEAYAVGNIGYPFASLVQETHSAEAWAVVEVSSFQAELMKYFRADSVVWSNISEDHLDRYDTMEQYFSAKAKMLEVAQAKSVLVGKDVAASYARFGRSLPDNSYVLDRSFIRVPENSVFSLKPQRDNFQLAAVMFRSWGYDPEVLHDAVKSFKQSPHRLLPVSRINGIEFWNDSKATNFSSTEAALKHFQCPIFWVGGGRAKGGRIEAFAQRIGHRIKKAFLTGDTAKDMCAVFSTFQVPCQSYKSLEEATLAAYKEATEGSVVLFSPGFASQKPFRNYSERGECFERVVNDIQVNLKMTP